ncbi:MAG: nuclear transport factor 2 family protein [Clostridiales Family XIII bacterium]|jgi:hypothetical protein|nr:nuclear transport factor 2 family protein [Clostridiales Family XIII bacterium]
MNSKKYTDEELLRRVLYTEEIKSLIHRRVYYLAADRYEDALRDLWVREEKWRRTASYGNNRGYCVGMDAITRYRVASCATPRARGRVSAHPASTGLVEPAGDGETAKGLWYCISQETNALPEGGASALWILEKLAVDFRRESDGWRIWHLVTATDLSCEAGTDYSAQAVREADGDNPGALDFGSPTIPMRTHDPTFNWWDNYPPPPAPYETFSDAISYGPEGHPQIKKGDGDSWAKL